MQSILHKFLFPAPRPSYNIESQPSYQAWIPWNPIITPELVSDSTARGIPAWYFQSQRSNCILLYFHGNAEDLGMCYGFLKYTHEQFKINVMGIDYPGYGLLSHLPPTSSLVNKVALTVVQYIVQELGIPHNRIIIVGRSVGTAPATFCASRFPLMGLVLVSPFLSLKDAVAAVAGKLASMVVSGHEFNSAKLIQNVTAPLLIIHGRSDSLIPSEQGERLFALCRSCTRKLLVLPELLEHNSNLYSKGEFLAEPFINFFALPGPVTAIPPAMPFKNRSFADMRKPPPSANPKPSLPSNRRFSNPNSIHKNNINFDGMSINGRLSNGPQLQNNLQYQDRQVNRDVPAYFQSSGVRPTSNGSSFFSPLIIMESERPFSTNQQQPQHSHQSRQSASKSSLNNNNARKLQQQSDDDSANMGLVKLSNNKLHVVNQSNPPRAGGDADEISDPCVQDGFGDLDRDFYHYSTPNFIQLDKFFDEKDSLAAAENPSKLLLPIGISPLMSANFSVEDLGIDPNNWDQLLDSPRLCLDVTTCRSPAPPNVGSPDIQMGIVHSGRRFKSAAGVGQRVSGVREEENDSSIYTSSQDKDDADSSSKMFNSSSSFLLKNEESNVITTANSPILGERRHLKNYLSISSNNKMEDEQTLDIEKLNIRPLLATCAAVPNNSRPLLFPPEELDFKIKSTNELKNSVTDFSPQNTSSNSSSISSVDFCVVATDPFSKERNTEDCRTIPQQHQINLNQMRYLDEENIPEIRKKKMILPSQRDFPGNVPPYPALLGPLSFTKTKHAGELKHERRLLMGIMPFDQDVSDEFVKKPHEAKGPIKAAGGRRGSHG